MDSNLMARWLGSSVESGLPVPPGIHWHWEAFEGVGPAEEPDRSHLQKEQAVTFWSQPYTPFSTPME
ncbi:hypothetical protein N7452_000140 [Penicillium brevicompactum]|uniref:Uncharacterized protein n=1 Tax=Penicillium brevicompactum TaxID=5074 RepID=A0A9W9QZW7_PENBR|nr:hypothetical protein N7452_000140 [Penicillium brevicompactum]